MINPPEHLLVFGYLPRLSSGVHRRSDCRKKLAKRILSRISLDYHVSPDGHFYSVPYQLTGKQVDIRLTAGAIEVFHEGLRVASHARSYVRDRATTLTEHQPKAHRQYLEWTPSRLLHWAGSAGPHTAELFGRILATKPHPEIGYRCCLGLVRLGEKHSIARLEAAAARALHYGAYSLARVESILKHHLENEPLPDTAPAPPLPPVLEHSNLRGAAYFNSIQ